MAQRRHHYERAFEGLLRSRRVPYIAVDEARRTLLPEAARSCPDLGPEGSGGGGIKNFDFVVYGRDRQLLVDVKGRKVARRSASQTSLWVESTGRLETWVTEDDVRSLAHWQAMFGSGYEAAFLFLYWWEAQPPDGLFDDVFEQGGRWYAARVVRLEDYAARMTVRSPKWRTVHLSRSDFDRVSTPFRAIGLGVDGNREIGSGSPALQR